MKHDERWWWCWTNNEWMMTGVHFDLCFGKKNIGQIFFPWFDTIDGGYVDFIGQQP